MPLLVAVLDLSAVQTSAMEKSINTIAMLVEFKRLANEMGKLHGRLIENSDRVKVLNDMLDQLSRQNEVLRLSSQAHPKASLESASRVIHEALQATNDPGILNQKISSLMLVLGQKLPRAEAQLRDVEQTINLLYASATYETELKILASLRPTHHTPSRSSGSLPISSYSKFGPSRCPCTAARNDELADQLKHKEAITLLDCNTLRLYSRIISSSLTFVSPKFRSKAYAVKVQISSRTHIPFGIRTYALVPDTEAIFNVVSRGDTDEMLKLFDTRKLSPFIRDTKGYSLLHYASCCGNLKILETLLQLGLGRCVDEKAPNGLTPGNMSLLNSLWDEKNGHKFIDRIIESLGKFSAETVYGQSPRIFLIGCCTGTADLEKLSKFQKRASLNFFQQPTINLLYAARLYVMASISSLHPDPNVFMYLTNVRCAEQLGSVPNSGEATVCTLHSAAIGLARYFRSPRHSFTREPRSRERRRGEKTWKNIVGSLVKGLGHNLHCSERVTLDLTMKGYSRSPPCKWVGSPMISIIHGMFLDALPFYDTLVHRRRKGHQSTTAGVGCSRQVRAVLWSPLEIWLNQLREAGIDLADYGRNEREIFIWQKRSDPEGLDFILRGVSQQGRDGNALPLHLADFDYGIFVEHWVFHWQVDFLKLAGEFWKGIETSSSSSDPLPGAWVS